MITCLVHSVLSQYKDINSLLFSGQKNGPLSFTASVLINHIYTKFVKNQGNFILNMKPQFI